MEGAATPTTLACNSRSCKRQVSVGLLQLEPRHSDVASSMARADELIAARLQDGTRLDVLVLPEMAFTGYLFRDREHALPLAEPAQDGSTFRWARAVAMRLQCGVLVGFIRLAENGRLYNSQMVVAPDGSLEACYDKHFLYAADKTWAEAGSGFQSLRPSWLGGLRIGLGICMDINPREFEAPWGAFEFATFHKQRQCDLILFSSAWCNRHPDDEQEGPVNGPDTMNYWASRLRPLLGSSTFFLAANRVGKERAELLRAGCRGDVTFVGSSCALSLREPAVLAALDTTQQALLVLTITLPALPTAAANR